MSTHQDPKKTSTAFRPIAIIVAVVALIGLAIWQIGPTAFSQTNPYLDDLSQNPTGAGSNPDGEAAVLEDGFPVERSADDVITGSTDATDLTGINEPGYENTVADEGSRTLSPSDVITREEGTVSDETGTVQAPEGS
ncbi:hypothetical protein [uncultured Marivita sp.]|uniref:hypothetical protein n=1 Tax=uncultured Marivita sp. TaxID=888080 RepID=UPI00261F317D|nr:hypothetical protein [uncultured Marivita sp.]